MMRWIVARSLHFRFLVVAAAAATLFFGLGQLRSTPLDVFPEFAPPRVEIQTPCLGLSAEEVEALISVPMEQALNGVDGLEVMRSRSIPDLSAIELLFKPGTDILKSRQLVQERIATVIPRLPTWAAPPVMMPPVSSTGRVMKIGVSSNDVSLNDLSMIGYWTIRARLLRVPGVANVPIWGERIKMPQVQVDPQRMRAHDVTLEQVMDVTSESLDSGLLQFSTGSVIGTGGSFETANQRMSIRHVSPITTPEDLAMVPLNERLNADGTPLRLDDVADVVEGTWPLFGDAVINDGPGLLMVVEKYPWANTLDVTRGVEKALSDLRLGLPGIDTDPSIFRPADFIQMALDNLTRSLLLGCVFVAVVLIVFLFEWRTALISMIAIPLSLVAGALALVASGASINTMVLAGFVIAVGVVVDDAIIDVENIVRRLRENRVAPANQQRSVASIILEGSLEVRSAIVYATLIDVTMLVPVFFIGGVSGAFFVPLALAYGLAVLASMVVALTVTPALSFILLQKAPIERRPSPVVTWLQRGYGRALIPVLRRPVIAYLAVGVISAIGLAAAPRLGQELFPAFKERDFLIHLISKPGTPVAEERRLVTRASRQVRQVDGVRNFGAHIGQALLADEISGVNFGEGWVSVDPTVDYDATVNAIREVVDTYPGTFHNVLTYLNERIDEVLSGEGHALVVRIFGPDLETLRDQAERVKGTLTGIDGVAEAHVELQEEIPQVQVEVKLDEALRYGLKPGDVRRAAATMLAGEEVGDLFRYGKAYDVNVWSTPATRANLDSIRALPLDTRNGGHVSMGEVADIRIVPASNLIQRQNDSRRIDVGADIRGRDVGAVAHDLDLRLASLQFPLGYHAEVLGEYAERQAAQNRLILFALAAAVGVFLLLGASFNNWRLAALAFAILPSALVGGVLAAVFGGGILSIGSLVGFLTVFGIAARNGIMLINHFQHLQRYEGEVFGLLLVLRGTRERLAPILMTALATGMALVPLVIAGDIPGHEIEHPMAIVILGGLLTSTVLNLFILPAVYLRFGRPSPSQ